MFIAAYGWGALAWRCLLYGSVAMLLVALRESLGNVLALALCTAWLAFHVILSLAHPLSELIVHAALFAVITTILFLPRHAPCFRSHGAI